MKSKIITAIFAIALSTIGLCSTISHANDQKSIIKAVTYSTSDLAAAQVSKFVGQNVNQMSTLKANSYDALVNRPLFSLSSSVTGSYIPNQDFTKKNRVFELATIFNDKLQQVIAKFSYNEAPKYNSHSINGDMPEDKNAINCDVKKQ
ncbi:hypothetical protein ACPUVO_09575 [Pseudocolwellia sp. HL-MZ19]|uniref:hypothetical protein n=1 Tax=unclassified Pseudocolwellia TaxID=2848178 RepID=UPI003CE94DE2